MFNYNSIKNILFSKGDIRLEDKKKMFTNLNKHIDEKKKKVIGSDAKIFFNDDSMKVDEEITLGFLLTVFL